MKKIIATVLAMVMALALCTTAFAAAQQYDAFDAETGATVTEDAYLMYVKATKTSIAFYWLAEKESDTFDSATDTMYVKVTKTADADIVLKYADKNTVAMYLAKVDAVNYAGTGVAFTEIGSKCGQYKLATGKTAKSILISCGSRLAPFDIPQLREIMAYDELQLDRIGDRKTAVFFTISDTTPTYNFLVALAFSQMFNLLCERADNVHGGRLPHHVRVLWDEAANTGQVPQLEKLVAVIRSREISLTLFYQQMAQCKAIYDKHAETILGNMDSVIFLGGRESSTIKEISENWLGKATIYMQTDGRSKGQSESYNQNTQRLGRELMTPAELATMPGDRCILQLRGLPPFYSPKYDLKQHPNYKYTAQADRVKNVFDLDKLINRRRRPGLNEVCEVYEADGTDAAPISEDEDILNYDDVDDPDAFV